MLNSELSHCSDECLLTQITNSYSVENNENNATNWDDRTDPWC